MLVTHPAVTFKMKENLELHSELSIDAFQRRWSVMYASNNDADEDGIGHVPWQKGFYVAGGMKEVKNLIMYLDSFVGFRREQEAKNPKGQTRIPSDMILKILNCTQEALSFEDGDLEHKLKISAATATLALQPPCPSRRYLTCNLQILPDAKAQITFEGETYMYRSLFDAAGIPGKYVDEDGAECEKEGAARYARGLPRADLTKPDHVAFIIRILSSFEETIMRVNIHEDAEGDQEEITTLKEKIDACQWVFTNSKPAAA